MSRVLLTADCKVCDWHARAVTGDEEAERHHRLDIGSHIDSLEHRKKAQAHFEKYGRPVEIICGSVDE